MPYAIVRIAKLKASNIAGSGMHVSRTRSTPNADRSKLEDNQTLIHNGDIDLALAEVVEQKINSTLQTRKIRTDAVHCVEMLLTASPEYFRPDHPADYGAYESAKLEEWKQATVKWLKQEYGSRIVRAELHMDEATPHIHAYLVPTDSQGQLNCKKMFGGRSKMFALQDSYSKAMKPLGLERGIKGSRAEHTDVKDYYQAVNAATEGLPDLQTIQARLAAYELLKREKAEVDRKLKTLAAERDKLALQLEAQKQFTDLQKQIANSANRDSISIEQVAIELQLAPSSFNPNLSPLELIQETLELKYEAAILWGNRKFGAGNASRLPSLSPQQIIAENPFQKFTPSTPAADVWESARRWLTDGQKLPSQLVNRLHDEGIIYADQRGLVFINRDLNGEITGATEMLREGENFQVQLIDGSSRTNGWYFFESAQGTIVEQVVITDHPLESIAYATLHPSNQPTLYLATNDGGWIPDLPTEVEVTIATDQPLVNLPVHCKTQHPASGSWRDDLARYLDRIMKDTVVEVTAKQQQINPQTFPQSPGYSRGR
jgi:Plasmid recombination enzyme